MRLHDVSLVKVTHTECHEVKGCIPTRTFTIIAMINKYGALDVFIMDDRFTPIWQGLTVLAARDFLLDCGGYVKRHLVFGIQDLEGFPKDCRDGRILGPGVLITSCAL